MLFFPLPVSRDTRDSLHSASRANIKASFSYPELSQLYHKINHGDIDPFSIPYDMCIHYIEDVMQTIVDESEVTTNLNTFEVKWSEVPQSCPTLCDTMDCSLPGSSIPGILQAGILEWVAMSFSRRSSQPRDRTWVSHIAGRRFAIWATREVKYLYKTCA